MAITDDLDIDVLDFWQDKLFLGQEFLTWLWLTSEEDGVFRLKDGRPAVEVWFEKSLRLESGRGVSKSSVTCQRPDDAEDQGAARPWVEALTAVRESKKLVLGRVGIRTEGRTWLLSLPAATLSPKSFKTVEGADFKDDGDESQVGRLLNRAALAMELIGVLDALFQHFLKLRLSKDWETKALPELRERLRRSGRETG